MRKLMTTVFAAALIVTTAGFAQDKSTASKQSRETQQDTKTTTNNGSAKSSSDTIYGKVESYEPGKSLKVTVPGKVTSTKSFSLDSKDWSYHLASDIKPGQWVMVSETTNNAGHKTLTVRHSSKGHASRVRGKTYR